MKKSVLIAGIGGASLGTEIFKCLRCSENYDIFGADISAYAYGLYQEGFAKTYLVDRENYIENIMNICRTEGIDVIIPGAEETLRLFCSSKSLFDKEDILLAINSEEVIDICSDKLKTFEYLASQGIAIPLTELINDPNEVSRLSYPCVIKPATGSGGSVFAYIAEDEEEAALYISYLNKRNVKALVQEYIPHQEGEYTVGVLSLPNGEVLSSIALKRSFDVKLSCLVKYNDRVISSGYSQGLIDDFRDIRRQAEDMALKLNSRGPLNVQGRLRHGVFYPFEINPRFSASTYLRAMAGFNEVDIFLQYLFHGKCEIPRSIRYGYYSRSFEEKYVSCEDIRNG